MILNSTHKNALISPARSIAGKVELYEGSTLLNTFNSTDALKSFTISRAGDKKFFGFGVSQEIELKLVDRERAINIQPDQILKVSFITNRSTVSPTPRFYVTEVQRDENTNELTVKGYDIIYKAKKHTVAELNLAAPYTMTDVVSKIMGVLGVSSSYDVKTRDAFNMEYPNGANFDGAETLREALDAIAGATQTIYFVNNSNAVTFRHMNKDGDPVLTIRKDDYFNLDSKTNRILSDICSATELGDNVIISAEGISGETQYVRDNPFWELRDDLPSLLEAAIGLVGGLSLYQFSCKWRGNYLVEPGDKIGLVTKDGNTITSYMLNEKYTYNGGLVAETSWDYSDNDESADNPVTLGDALKKTYAKVDKANQQIDIVAGETAAIKVTNDSIQQTVVQLDDNMSDVLSEVNTKVSADEVTFSIQKAMEQGVVAVTTTTGFTFNEEGLHISKTGSEITTTITEDGMTVLRDNDEVLVADNLGVKAEDLHATTFLIIGKNSRFEDYGNRTGCFWIGD